MEFGLEVHTQGVYVAHACLFGKLLFYFCCLSSFKVSLNVIASKGSLDEVCLGQFFACSTNSRAVKAKLLCCCIAKNLFSKA